MKRSRKLVRQMHRLVCRPHHNRRYALKLLTLPKIVRDLVHHPDYGLNEEGVALLLYDVFKVSPPMALHLLSLIGLTGPGWVMGVIADNGSAEGYAQEMYSAMLNLASQPTTVSICRSGISHMDLSTVQYPSWTRNGLGTQRALRKRRMDWMIPLILNWMTTSLNPMPLRIHMSSWSLRLAASIGSCRLSATPRMQTLSILVRRSCFAPLERMSLPKTLLTTLVSPLVWLTRCVLPPHPKSSRWSLFG